MSGETDRLVALFASLAKRNGTSVTVTPEWRATASQLLDEHAASDVEAVIRYTLEDDFWQTRCFSLPYLHEKWDVLHSQAEAKGHTAIRKDGKVDHRATLARNLWGASIDGEPLFPTQQDLDDYLEEEAA